MPKLCLGAHVIVSFVVSLLKFKKFLIYLLKKMLQIISLP
jgi:hypothetical protein